jgi:aldose 1-epimerase
LLVFDGDEISIAIDLDQGARLASLQWRDMEFVVPFRGQELSWGWFAMAPYAGRIKNGILRDSKGKKHQLPNSIDPMGTQHALIGFGVTSSWEDLGGGKQILDLPNPFQGASVTQQFEILGNSLRWSLDFQANGCDLPVTLGFHPWFARNIGKGGSAEILLSAKKMFQRGEDYLPTGRLVDPIPPPWDDTFTELSSTPKIIWPGAATVSIDSNCPYLMVYSYDESGLCVEPVSAPPDAQNLGIKGETYIECLITFDEHFVN